MQQIKQKRVEMIENVEQETYLLYTKKILLYITYRILEIVIIKTLSCSLKYHKTHINYSIIRT